MNVLLFEKFILESHEKRSRSDNCLKVHQKYIFTRKSFMMNAILKFAIDLN